MATRTTNDRTFEMETKYDDDDDDDDDDVLSWKLLKDMFSVHVECVAEIMLILFQHCISDVITAQYWTVWASSSWRYRLISAVVLTV